MSNLNVISALEFGGRVDDFTGSVELCYRLN
jgi:hypothetical protein